MSRTLFLESVAGIAGDMFAAAFLDAGLVTREELERLPVELDLEGVRLDITHPIKATMRATHVRVTADGDAWKRALGASHDHAHGAVGVMPPSGAAEGEWSVTKVASIDDNPGHLLSAHAHAHAHSHEPGHWHTHYRDLDAFLERSRLEPAVRQLARDVFGVIARAEAEAHGMSVDDIAFHEVGAVDSMLDVVMSAFCVVRSQVDAIYATPVKLGRGVIRIQHGTHPVPPPASARIVLGMPVAAVPEAITRPNVELSTPTGLAILKALHVQFVDAMPSGTPVAQGMGAGTMDLGAYPNVFRVTVLEGTGEKTASLPYERDEVVEIACNLDDETAERTAWVVEKLMALGALDAWVRPVTGKKGRAGVELSVLASIDEWEKLADWLLRNSSTFGVRHRRWDRLKLARRFERRVTPQGELTYKVGLTTTGDVLKEKPEFEELRKLWDREGGT